MESQTFNFKFSPPFESVKKNNFKESLLDVLVVCVNGFFYITINK